MLLASERVADWRHGAALLGYSKLYGQVPGGQAEYLRVEQAHFGPIKVPEGPPDDRFVYLSDVLPTAWQAVQYAAIPDGGTLAVLGLGPIGDMACRIAMQGNTGTVIGLDFVPERLARARARGVETVDLSAATEPVDLIREMTDGRGPDSVIDAVGMEAHGMGIGKLAQTAAALLPDAVASRVMKKAGIDRLGALLLAVELVRRGGTISISGVYGGQTDPLPMMTLFDKQIQLRMGQANVRRWIDDLMPLVEDEADPLGLEDFATHHLPLDRAADAYDMFQRKRDGAVKILLRP